MTQQEIELAGQLDWVWFPEPTDCKEKTDFHVLSSDLHMYIMAYVPLLNKILKHQTNTPHSRQRETLYNHKRDNSPGQCDNFNYVISIFWEQWQTWREGPLMFNNGRNRPSENHQVECIEGYYRSQMALPHREQSQKTQILFHKLKMTNHIKYQTQWNKK